jgi:hypothetical protein
MAGKVTPEVGANAKSQAAAAHPTTITLVRLCVAAWLVPGLGHLLLKRGWRALILFASIISMFVLGLEMQGQFFSTSSVSYLEVLGHYGELCVGLAMPAAKFFGYSGGDPFFVSSDFGTAYLVAAGMLNMLAVLDCFDIAMNRKA